MDGWKEGSVRFNYVEICRKYYWKNCRMKMTHDCYILVLIISQ